MDSMADVLLRIDRLYGRASCECKDLKRKARDPHVCYFVCSSHSLKQCDPGYQLRVPDGIERFMGISPERLCSGNFSEYAECTGFLTLCLPSFKTIYGYPESSEVEVWASCPLKRKTSFFQKNADNQQKIRFWSVAFYATKEYY